MYSIVRNGRFVSLYNGRPVLFRLKAEAQKELGFCRIRITDKLRVAKVKLVEVVGSTKGGTK